jgi:hypothetical protein
MTAQSQATGQEVDQDALKKETVDNMVGNVLLIQAADEAKISLSAKEVEATLQELATGNGVETTEEFLTLLEEQGRHRGADRAGAAPATSDSRRQKAVRMSTSPARHARCPSLQRASISVFVECRDRTTEATTTQITTRATTTR